MPILRYRTVRIFTAACVLALITLPGAVKSAGPDEKTRFDYAMSLYSQGAYDPAVKEMTEFVKDFPKGRYSDDAYYWLGKHYMAQGKGKDALDQYRIILALIPDGDMAPSAQFELASYWFNPSNPGRDLEKAIAEFMKIPFFYPDCPLADDAEYYAAICQLEKGNYAEAVSGLSAFMEKYPSSEFAAPAGYRTGIAYLLEGKTADALSALQSVRDAHPAGLYAEDALMAAELALRARDRSPLTLMSTQGEKGGAPGMFNKPQGVALGPEGRLYVADTANGRVQAFVFRDGKLELASQSFAPATLEKEDRMDEPSGVAAGPWGRVYVTDSGHNRVQVFEPDGRLMLSFGRKGEGDGELRSPSGIAVDAGGFSFVADTGNRRVVMFDPSGRFVR
ncbi:MAG TPA: tetratricopeptide repeat protein, partial [Nitrospirota bacterium]